MKVQSRSAYKVYLAPLEESHIQDYMGRSDDPELIRTMGWKPFGPDEKDRFLESARVLTLPYCGNGDPAIFSIIAKDEERPIGYVVLKGIHPENSSAEVGIAVMDRDYRSHGYGSDAIDLAVRYAFQDLNLILVGLTVFPTNIGAVKAYEKIGFLTKDVLKESWTMPNGEKLDMLLMELPRRNWKPKYS